MKLGIVLPSYMYSEERKRLAADTFYSLARTEPLFENARLLLLVKVGHAFEYTDAVNRLSDNFNVVLRTDDGLIGTEQTLAYGTDYLIKNFNVDFVTWMGDDALFNTMWLWQLHNLIERHPQARSWSVYRSAYEWHHKTLNDQGHDVLVRSICGHGLTFTNTEWKEWAINWSKLTDYDTLDLRHFAERPGERWVTKESFVQHTGKVGVHCTESTPEYARDFIGAR